MLITYIRIEKERGRGRRFAYTNAKILAVPQLSVLIIPGDFLARNIFGVYFFCVGPVGVFFVFERN
jgi:hypothetical protein